MNEGVLIYFYCQVVAACTLTAANWVLVMKKEVICFN